jgi:hypothetical protein
MGVKEILRKMHDICKIINRNMENEMFKMENKLQRFEDRTFVGKLLTTLITCACIQLALQGKEISIDNHLKFFVFGAVMTVEGTIFNVWKAYQLKKYCRKLQDLKNKYIDKAIEARKLIESLNLTVKTTQKTLKLDYKTALFLVIGGKDLAVISNFVEVFNNCHISKLARSTKFTTSEFNYLMQFFEMFGYAPKDRTLTVPSKASKRKVPVTTQTSSREVVEAVVIINNFVKAPITLESSTEARIKLYSAVTALYVSISKLDDIMIKAQKLVRSWEHDVKQVRRIELKIARKRKLRDVWRKKQKQTEIKKQIKTRNQQMPNQENKKNQEDKIIEKRKELDLESVD